MRTRRLLQDALLELMGEQSFRKIYVSQIAERAGVARPTFYLHFRSSEDLLLSHLDEIFERYMNELEPFLSVQNQGSLATRLFEQLQHHSTLIELLVRTEDDISHLVMERLQQYIGALFRRLGLDEETGILPPHLAGFVRSTVTGATYSLILEWVKSGRPYSPQVMGGILMTLIRPGIESLMLNHQVSFPPAPS